MNTQGQLVPKSDVIETLRVTVPLDPWLSLKALSAASGLSVRTLRAHITHPTRPLPCFRVGGKVLIRWSEFQRWMEAHRHTPDLPALVDEIITEIRR